MNSIDLFLLICNSFVLKVMGMVYCSIFYCFVWQIIKNRVNAARHLKRALEV